MGCAPLTCGQRPSQTPYTQVSTKREDLTKFSQIRSGIRSLAESKGPRLSENSAIRVRVRLDTQLASLHKICIVHPVRRTPASAADRVEHRRPGARLGHAREQSTAVDSATGGRRLTGKPATESNLSLRAPAQRGFRSERLPGVCSHRVRPSITIFLPRAGGGEGTADGGAVDDVAGSGSNVSRPPSAVGLSARFWWAGPIGCRVVAGLARAQ